MDSFWLRILRIANAEMYHRLESNSCNFTFWSRMKYFGNNLNYSNLTYFRNVGYNVFKTTKILHKLFT